MSLCLSAAVTIVPETQTLVTMGLSLCNSEAKESFLHQVFFHVFAIVTKNQTEHEKDTYSVFSLTPRAPGLW